VASFCCAGVSAGGRPICCPRALARLLPSAVRVRIRSRCTSANPPNTAISNLPALVPVSAHGTGAGAGVGPRLGKRAELRLAIDDALDDGEQVKGAAREAVNPRHRHHVAGGEGLQHFEKLAPVVVRAGHLLAVNLGAACSAYLFKLGVEDLPVGADAGIADRVVRR
jgi:hypothetical protein